MVRGLLTCLLALGLAGFASAAAQPPSESPAATAETLSPAERARTVEDLAKALEALYLSPKAGRRYAGALRSHMRRGRYAGIHDAKALGDRLTADLRAVAPDAHLRLLANAVFEHGPEPGGVATAGLPEGIEEMRMIGAVAYLRFTAFPHDPRTAPATRAFLVENAGRAKAVIVDARALPGGGIEVMDAMLPLFFAKRTILARLETRAAADKESPFPDGPTLVRKAGRAGYVTRDHIVAPDMGERRLRAVPLFYLTSAKTASAGEHLAMVLKRTGRGTLIGETTRGAGHFVALAPVGSGLTALIPIGRASDPDTGRDWEGRGVAPDIAVPAETALDEALRRTAAMGIAR